MHRMTMVCCGRTGNQFPILTSEFFHGRETDIGSRENVLDLLSRVESIDSKIFARNYKGTKFRLVPDVLLVPSYAEQGVCWEPFDHANRVATRGRLVIPMYCRNLTEAVLTACGDLRWQASKEKESYYWMQDGLTGGYYQWREKNKLRGDLKAAFIKDYITWVVYESKGQARLDKELRQVFWEQLPFPEPLRASLRSRSAVYQGLPA
jgi:hypothetical protein